jgi:hypothetical protein
VPIFDTDMPRVHGAFLAKLPCSQRQIGLDQHQDAVTAPEPAQPGQERCALGGAQKKREPSRKRAGLEYREQTNERFNGEGVR